MQRITTALLISAGFLFAGCSGPSETSAPAASAPPDTNAYMQSLTPKSVNPGSVRIPPMQGLSGTRPAMALGKPPADITAHSFTQLAGSAAYVAAGRDGTFWVLSKSELPGGDHAIYHYVNGAFVNVPGAARRIAIGPDNTPWVVNAAGGVYHLVGGTFKGIAGAASEIAVGGTASAPLVEVISNRSPGEYGAGIYQYHAASKTWSQLPGAAETVAASVDPGTYPALTIHPGGFYVTNHLGGIYYSNPGSGYVSLPGGALRLAPTASGGLFALGDPTNATRHGIYYNDLHTGTWTQLPEAAVSIAASPTTLYAIGAAGGIYTSPVQGARHP